MNFRLSFLNSNVLLKLNHYSLIEKKVKNKVTKLFINHIS